ncbi:MAG: TetR/AcrR family transcriptional regulator [Myxococcales bacterium]|jgi:TetR/AcrR family transcriptional regulator|nr:MAG: TetR/AcrR family transcriptional regulator [Myxococcales bacterium]
MAVTTPPPNEAHAVPRDRAKRGGDLTATRILDAAEDLFAERGYAGTTLRDVATLVGVRNPSIYNHFAGKEALYEAVLGRVIGPVLDALSDLIAAGPDADRESVIGKTMEILGEHPNVARLLLHETLGGGDRLTPILKDWIGPIFARSHELISRSPGTARWETDQLPLLVLAMYHIVVGYFTIAPIYSELGGEDLLAEEMRARQTRLLHQIADLLFAAPATETP